MAAYLKLGDIKGQVQEKNHKDWIELIDSSQHIHRPSMGGHGGMSGVGAGSVHVENLVLTKLLDASTPMISELACKGDNIPEVELHYCRADGDHAPYYQVKLKDVKVANYMITAHGTGEGVNTESLALTFSEIEWNYTKFKDDGKKDGDVKTKFKVRQVST